MRFRKNININIVSLLFILITFSANGVESRSAHQYHCINYTTNEVDTGIWPSEDMPALLKALGPRMLGNSECFIVKSPVSIDEQWVRMRNWNEFFGIPSNDELDFKKKEALDNCINNPGLPRCLKKITLSPQEDKILQNIQRLNNSPDNLEMKINRIFKDYKNEGTGQKISESERKQNLGLVNRYQTILSGLSKNYSNAIQLAQISDANFAAERNRRETASRLKREAEVAQARYEQAKNSGPQSSACQNWKQVNQGVGQLSSFAKMGGVDTTYVDQGLQLSETGAAVCQMIDQPTLDNFFQLAQQSMKAYQAYEQGSPNHHQSNHGYDTSSNNGSGTIDRCQAYSMDDSACTVMYDSCYKQTLGGQELCRCTKKWLNTQGQVMTVQEGQSRPAYECN